MKKSEIPDMELGLFFELSQDLLCIAGADGYFKRINASFERVLGFSTAELLSRPFFDFVHLADLPKTRDEIQRLSKGIPSVDFRTRFRTNRGGYVHLTWSATPGADGRLYAIARDTTLLFEAEERLRVANITILSQKRALDSSAIVAETDIEGRIIYANDKFLEISKYSRGELIGQDHRVINSGEHPKKFFKDLWQTINKGQVWHGEIKNRAKDGTFYWVDSTVYPVMDEENKLQRFISVRFDITDKKEALLNLQAAKEKAVIADQTKSEFLYSMSHEIRTPLNGIIGMTGLLQETELNPEQREFSEAISQSGKTLLTIINEILDFSKIEAGKVELEVTEFDLVSYLKDLLTPFQYTVKKKSINFSLNCPDYPYLVYGDDGRIGQVVSNLVSNAIKFTKAGGVTVRSDLVSRGDRTAFVLTVHDTGIGIPESAKSRIFQAFSQAERSTSRHFGGTGLGLSISKRLTEMMGGKINFESESGKGTTFKVELLLKTGKRMPKQSQISSQVPIQSAPLLGRILIAEDNAVNQFVIGRMLDKIGCKYHIVANGNEVLDAMRESEFDLILMDCQMPEMDGYTASRLIRKSDSLNNTIPIIALTANAVQGDELKCREAGMSGYLSKPIDRKALDAALRRYLLSTSQSSQGALIDQTVLGQFDELQMEGEPDILIEVIDSFFATSPRRIAAISEFIGNQDMAAAAREAHALKSGAQALGAMLLGQFCQKMEDLGGSKDVAAVRSLFELLKNAYDQSCKELAEVKAKQGVGSVKKAG